MEILFRNSVNLSSIVLSDSWLLIWGLNKRKDKGKKELKRKEKGRKEKETEGKERKFLNPCTQDQTFVS